MLALKRASRVSTAKWVRRRPKKKNNKGTWVFGGNPDHKQEICERTGDDWNCDQLVEIKHGTKKEDFFKKTTKFQIFRKESSHICAKKVQCTKRCVHDNTWNDNICSFWDADCFKREKKGAQLCGRRGIGNQRVCWPNQNPKKCTPARRPWWQDTCKPVPNLAARAWTQKLAVTCKSPDSFRIKASRNAGNNMCLDLNMGNHDVIMWQCHNHDNQRWYWVGDQLKNLQAQSKCLTKNGKNNGDYVNLKAEECTSHWRPRDDQWLSYTKKEEWHKYGTLKFLKGNECVDWSAGWGSRKVIAYPCHSGDNQIWILSDLKKGDVPV